MPARLRTAAVCGFRLYCLGNHRIAPLYTSTPRTSDNVDYYSALGVPHDASAASIKKQFYSLSKLHHPDHNPQDPSASARFVRISEAYAVLGHPSKRERYDREVLHVAGPRISRPASHSSSSNTPFGARPASGLSRRRSHFRGPPPSFYRSGGWGTQGAKRSAGHDGRTSPDGTTYKTNNIGSNSTTGGGFSPGQPPRHGWNDVPHFDRASHLWTQEQQERRRKRRLEEAGMPSNGRGGDFIFNFLLVAGVVILASLTPGVYGKFGNSKREENNQ